MFNVRVFISDKSSKMAERIWREKLSFKKTLFC